jgi:hypothetical protein
VIDDEWIRRTLAERARRRARGLTATRMAEAYTALYSELSLLERV